MNPYEPEHWRNICKEVESVFKKVMEICGKHLNTSSKSNIVSCLFEGISGEYFNSIGLATKVTKKDSDADLVFPTGPCEIKVTHVDKTLTKSHQWMGGKYSERTGDFVFVMWHLHEQHESSLFNEGDYIMFSVSKCDIEKGDWELIDKRPNPKYYATKFELKTLKEKDYTPLVGNRNGDYFILENV